MRSPVPPEGTECAVATCEKIAIGNSNQGIPYCDTHRKFLQLTLAPLTQSPHQILCSQMRLAHQDLGIFVACNRSVRRKWGGLLYISSQFCPTLLLHTRKFSSSKNHNSLISLHAPGAQLDRVLPSEGELYPTNHTVFRIPPRFLCDWNRPISL